MKKIGLNIVIAGGIFFCLLSGAELRAQYSLVMPVGVGVFGMGDPLNGGFIPLENVQANFDRVDNATRDMALKNSLIGIINMTQYNARETGQNLLESFWQAYQQAEIQQKTAEGASPSATSGDNDDGTKWYQFSGRFDIFKNWIEDKMQEFGVFSEWKGESFDGLAKNNSKTEFSLTFNRQSEVYFGNNHITQGTVFQFSLTDPTDNFETYTQQGERQKIWDSMKGQYSEIYSITVTDEMNWGGKFYGTPGKTEQGKQMISSHSRTWDLTRGIYTESRQRNEYANNFHMPIKTARHVFERGFDKSGKRYEREYDMSQENITWEWVASGDPVTGGTFETKSFDQIFRDYSTPDRQTFSHNEFTYKNGFAESQLIVTRETSPGVDNSYVMVEKYLDRYVDNKTSDQITLHMDGALDFDTASKEGKLLQTIINSSELSDGLDLTNPDDLRTYAERVSKKLKSSVGELEGGEELVAQVDGDKESNQAINEKSQQSKKKLNKSVCKKWADNGECEEYEEEEIEGTSDVAENTDTNTEKIVEGEDVEGRKITISREEKKYNDKGFLAWQKETVVVRGKDKDGTELNFTQTVEKTYKAFTPFGQPTEMKQVIRSEATPDVETTIEMMIEYDQYSKVTKQRTEVWERGLNGKELNRHTVTLKDNIKYDSAGLELSYREEETEYDISGDIIGHSVRETTNITYNEKGLMTGYDMHTVVNGTDTQDGHEFTVTTDTKLRDIGYNDLGIRTSWTETSVNSASPDLTVENTYVVTQVDRFGRITEFKINEHSYGETNGTSLDTERSIIRIISYNSLGQEEKAYEEVLEGKKTTKSTITNEYDEYGRLSKETREVKVSGEDKDDEGKTVTLDYSYTMTRTGFEYNNAGMVQHYKADIVNESSPDLKITQEVWLGYNKYGQVDYEKTDMWEIGTSKKTNKDGEITDEDEKVNRHTVSVKHDIKYNGLGQEISYITDTKEEKYDENGKAMVMRDVKETIKGIKYDTKGRIIEQTTTTTGKERFLDDDGKYGELQDVNMTRRTYNIKYIEGLNLRKSWEETITGEGIESAINRSYNILEFDRFGQLLDIDVEGDGVEKDDKVKAEDEEDLRT